MEGSLERRAARVVGGRQPPARRRALGAGRVAKAYCARAARTVCETAIQVHGGIGNTWECMAHVYLRRALLSSQWFGDDGVQLRALERERSGGDRWTFVTRPPKPSSAAACAPGSPSNNPGPAGVVDRRRVLGAPGRVAHRALRRGLLRAELAGAVRRPRPADRVRRDPRRGARRGRRAAAAEPRLPRAGHQHARQRRDQGPLPSRPDQRARPLVPGLQRARRRLRPRVAAHDRDTRRRRVRDRRPQDLDELLRRRRLVLPARAHRPRRAEAQGPRRRSRSRCTSPASSSGRCG